MSDPYATILREIHDDPNAFSLLVIASWCGKSADEIERLEAENAYLKHFATSIEVQYGNSGFTGIDHELAKLKAAVQEGNDDLL